MPATRQRVSWASWSPRMVVSRSQDAARSRHASRADPLREADRRRRGRQAWVRSLVLQAAAGDLLCALIVLSVVVLSHAGPASATDAVAVAGVTAAWGLLLWRAGGYDWHRLGYGAEEFRTIARCAVELVAALSVLAFALQQQLPRRYVLVAVPALALATAVYRQLLRTRLHAARSRGDDLLRTLVVGAPRTARACTADLNANRHNGFEVVGMCLTPMQTDAEPMPVPVWGTVSDVPPVVVEHQIDVVLVADRGLSGESLRRLSWALERTGTELVVAAGIVEVASSRTRMRPAAGLSLIHLKGPTHVHAPRLKEVVDRAAAAVLLVLSLTVLAVAMAAVRLSGPGPIFYRQTRIGRNGQPFVMYKLRTMVPDADREVSRLAAYSDRDGLMFKMRRDPRVTPVGRWLRRFSLDEIPQLWNVMRGDMALVGPRPPLPEEYLQYQDAVHRRLHVKPGVTGLWQVSGRSDLSWEESIRLDLRYVDNWSIGLDLQILWKTMRAVLRGHGAY